MSGIQSYNDPYNNYGANNNVNNDVEDDDDSGQRQIWAVLSWIAVALTLILNIAVIAIVVVGRNYFNAMNRVIVLVALSDLLYGMFVSPFYVENYVWLSWGQSDGYCGFFVYAFTFHDLFAPLMLIIISAYVALQLAATSTSITTTLSPESRVTTSTRESLDFKRPMFIGCALVAILIPTCLSIPAAVNSDVADSREINPRGPSIVECRTSDVYTMILSYLVSSSVLFCFAMSFLFSLCIVGSPFLKNTMDREEYLQRWRMLLTLALVDGLYIATGFLINFKEISRIFYNCCDIQDPFQGVDTVTYDVWSFVFLILEQVSRPLTILCFYYKYLLKDYSVLED